MENDVLVSYLCRFGCSGWGTVRKGCGFDGISFAIAEMDLRRTIQKGSGNIFCRCP
ncbi:hypothetical protein [Intestinibacillus massiliensis]